MFLNCGVPTLRRTQTQPDSHFTSSTTLDAAFASPHPRMVFRMQMVAFDLKLETRPWVMCLQYSDLVDVGRWSFHPLRIAPESVVSASQMLAHLVHSSKHHFEQQHLLLHSFAVSDMTLLVGWMGRLRL